ncbi:MAG: Ig-like domain repeat protein [Chloroflexi bacterium]|nr:Ig-like domain repeat protein [Chloroflexota bacterium]
MPGTPRPATRAGGRSTRLTSGVAVMMAALLFPSWVAAATATSVTLSAAQATIVAGDRASLTASINPGAGGGSVTFSSQSGVLGTAPVDPETNAAGISPTLAPGSHSIVASFTGFGDFTGSVSAPFVVTVTLGTTGGFSTSTSVALATPGAVEGDLATLRATVSPRPDDGRVQFIKGDRLLGTAPIDTATGQSVLAISTLAAGSHQIVAIFNGSTAFAASASPAHRSSSARTAWCAQRASRCRTRLSTRSSTGSATSSRSAVGPMNGRRSRSGS